MKYVFFFLALFLILPGHSQVTGPGGVKGACIWEITEFKQNGLARWKSKLEKCADTNFLMKGTIKTINNNPALLLTDKSNPINYTLNLGKSAAFSLFTVCQEIDTVSERVIFNLENDTAAETILTNRRIAALDLYHYASYQGKMVPFPKIYSYTQNKSIDQGTAERRLQFGRPPRNQHLPVSNYNGIIPEFILFPRSVSPIERQKVESYLALKYGISLNQEFPVSYLNSTGNTIWDAELNATHCHNIAGIGRDDLSGLNQRISESTQIPGVMKIGVSGELKNNTFMIWGDNGKPLRFVEEPRLRRMLREWKASTYNFKGDSLNIAISELLFDDINPLLAGETYWMMIDRSGTGKFPFKQTDYLQCKQSILPEKIISFSSVIIDNDLSGSDVFTLLAAPSFFVRSIVKNPSCSLAYSGAIQTEIAGGKPPFDILLKGISNQTLTVYSNKYDRHYVFEGISQGSYLIQVIDEDQKIFTEEIRVSNLHSWESKIDRSYKLVEGEALVLNAQNGMPAVNYSYFWTLPDGSLLNDEEIRIDQPGTYLLSVTDENNCNSTIDIKVRQIGKSVFKDIELFPNPVRGWFAVRISLEREMDINVIISNAAGKILKQSLLRNDQYYLYKDIIHEPGIYLITLITDIDKETLKLIVI